MRYSKVEKIEESVTYKLPRGYLVTLSKLIFDMKKDGWGLSNIMKGKDHQKVVFTRAGHGTS